MAGVLTSHSGAVILLAQLSSLRGRVHTCQVGQVALREPKPASPGPWGCHGEAGPVVGPPVLKT